MDPRLAIQVYTGPTATAEAAAEAVMHHLSDRQLREMLADALYTGRKQGTQEGRRVTVKEANETIADLQSKQELEEALLYSGVAGIALGNVFEKTQGDEDDA